MRRVWFVLGLGLLAFGAYTMFHGDTNGTRPVSSALWAAGLVVAHDGVFAPVVFLGGFLLRRVPWWVRSGLVLLGVLGLLFLPRLVSPAPEQNSSVWPALSTVDVVLALVVAIGCLATGFVATGFVAAGTARRRSGPAGTTAP
jgi:hypothetical protein